MAPPSQVVLFPTSPASALGPRSTPDFRDKEKGVNVQVLVRCRPLNEEEVRTCAPQVISCNDLRREVTVNLNIASKQIDRTFTFDKVFGPQTQQQDLYDQAIVPIVNEVLEGFNCTIFAYGQTGTGKTFTMEGNGRKTKDRGMPVDAGVIPRAVQQIVDTLENQNAEYSMKVTFLELYNEEITDLLAPEDISRPVDDKQKKPLALMEDGKGGVLVRGLEEEVVYSANEIYNLLERGSAKRRTAETLLNKQSSRSHSIFSITIHIKEATPEGEELMKCGKLNLVDLAGSENISRSGARDGRAREAGEINKSLLTLGRVITALVEHLGHIPYRDSKLTRLLRDSLGGKTKTCIIATVSPSVHCLEETLSTLDYAHRAKNIKNKPEVNQKMMKSALIKDLYSEMEKLKAEVNAAREKNGVYLPRERYLQEEAEKKAMSERIEQMEFDIEVKNKRLDTIQEELDSERSHCEDLNERLERSQKRLRFTEEALDEAKKEISQAQYSIKERDFIISKFQQSEDVLVKQAENLRSQLEASIAEITGLHSKIERKSKVEVNNQKTLQSFHGDLGVQLKALHGSVVSSVGHQQKQIQQMQDHIKCFTDSKNKVTEVLRQTTDRVKEIFLSGLRQINGLAQSHEKESTVTFEKVNSAISAHSSALQELLASSICEAEMLFNDTSNALLRQQEVIVSFVSQQQEKAQQNLDAAKEISKKLEAFYELEEEHTVSIKGSVVESHENVQKTLVDLERVYEEVAKQEESKLMEKISEMLVAATARKSEIVNSRISILRNLVAKNSNNIEQDVLKICEARSESQSHWMNYMKEAENHFHHVCDNLNSNETCLKEIAGHCVKQTAEATGGWKKAQESLQVLERNNHLAVDLVVKEGVYGNGLLLTNLEEMNTSMESQLQDGNIALLKSIDDCVDVDMEATTSMQTTLASQGETLMELEVSHGNGTNGIQSEADSCLKKEYMEDEPTGLTPTKRTIDVASEESIKALRAPEIEKLLEEFRGTAKTSTLQESCNNNEEEEFGCPENNDVEKRVSQGTQRTVKDSKIPIPPDSSLLKDNRLPLANVN